MQRESTSASTEWQTGIKAAAFALGLVISCGIVARRLDSLAALGLCLLVAAGALLLGFRSLQRMSARETWQNEKELSRSCGPEPSDNVLLELQARLEFAPVALWSSQEMSLKALNAAARRLSVPGNGVDAAMLSRVAQTSRPGRRTLVTFDSERGLERAMLATSELIVAGQEQKLLALMPIESELEAETLTAWRQLVYVLTHEIMNSLTPIASLSQTAREMLGELPDEPQEDIAVALEAISRRATHLAQFVTRYRSISRLPEPVFETVRLKRVFDRIAQLVTPGWQVRGGSVRFSAEPDSIELRADPGQLEQALLNLIQNAAQATADVRQPQLQVIARLVRGGRLIIEIIDNGPAVQAGLESHIFTPFFSTRKGGSGIGLTLVRDQIHAMGGTVRYSKRVGGGACFVLAF